MIVAGHLSKRYGTTIAVADLSFTCWPGTVTGFLGSNGAGKSTTLRMLCGLTEPTSGSATIDGKPYRSLDQPARQVGVLLDASAQHPGRTGREVLRLTAAVLGLPDTRVEEILSLVDLQHAAGRRVGGYSLGMRQRLGIGHALLGGPNALVLDEPANGLDPGGIHWMRGLLRDFADRGGTVLLSSHLLREVEAVADQLVIIGNGHLLVKGAAADLLANQGSIVHAVDPAALASCLDETGIRYHVDPEGRFGVDATTEAVGRAAASRAVILTELRHPDGTGLEDLFLALTEGDPHPGQEPQQ